VERTLRRFGKPWGSGSDNERRRAFVERNRHFPACIELVCFGCRALSPSPLSESTFTNIGITQSADESMTDPVFAIAR
jgi:hypothetical protein